MTTGTNPVLKPAYDWLLDPELLQHEDKILAVISPDGWYGTDGVTMRDPITLDDFHERLGRSAIMERDVPGLRPAHGWLESSVIQIDPAYVVSIHDWDGWRKDDGVNPETPITLIDFLTRFQECTKSSRPAAASV